jgi:leucine dehydrogenase
MHKPPITSAGADHEGIRWAHDEASGLRAVVAIHNTARGPAFGGCRMWHYADEAAAEHDALRLAAGMSLKNALADLPFGGGKAVIMAPTGPRDRRALFAAFARLVESLEGRYITAEDVGVTTDDMRVVREGTRHVSGLPREGAFGGDPSPMTAWGVFISIDEAVHSLGRSGLDGTTVAVQGLGAVGSVLCELLHGAGCKLVVADVDADRVARMRQRFGAEMSHVDDIAAAAVDVFAPCALGAVLNSHSIPKIRAKIVAGAANNQLATAMDGEALHARGILYLPDFLVNAGGIISVAREFLGDTDQAAVKDEVNKIRYRVEELIDRAQHRGASTAHVAREWAESKLGKAAR